MIIAAETLCLPCWRLTTTTISTKTTKENDNNIDNKTNNNNNNCSLHIVFALLENVRNNFEEFYPTFLLHIFPVFHYPLYRCELPHHFDDGNVDEEGDGDDDDGDGDGNDSDDADDADDADGNDGANFPLSVSFPKASKFPPLLLSINYQKLENIEMVIGN